MKIFNNLCEIKNIDKTVTALGNFDGIHLGHLELISFAVKRSKEIGAKAAVFTFSNHPRNIIKGAGGVKNIVYEERKREILESIGVEYMFNLPFNDEIMKMSPETFVKDLLVDAFNAEEVCCGFNYRFGYKAGGTTETLHELGVKYGFKENILPAFKVKGEIVSSTLIRGLIEAGDMETCKEYLGRPYEIDGAVVEGNHMGRSMEFPTANILPDETMVTPANGVYITQCTYDGATYPSITNVGEKPTIGKFAKNIETHILDRDVSLYGKEIRVEFLKRVRGEKKFESIEALQAEVLKNCQTAREYHKK